MKKYNIALMLVVATIIGFTACNESTTTTAETTEITQMDSTAKQAKEAREKLEEQTKKVEASIEKLDEEFKTNN